MKNFLDWIINHWALFFLAAALAILAAAYFFQFALGYQPCELCLYQRYPYMLIIPLAFLAFLMRQKTELTTKRAARGLLAVITILFFLGTFLAVHHIGVEQGYWEAFTACVGVEFDPNLSSEEAFESLPAVSVPCDARETFLGISFAEYNAVLATLLGGLGVYVLRKTS